MSEIAVNTLAPIRRVTIKDEITIRLQEANRLFFIKRKLIKQATIKGQQVPNVCCTNSVYLCSQLGLLREFQFPGIGESSSRELDRESASISIPAIPVNRELNVLRISIRYAHRPFRLRGLR